MNPILEALYVSLDSRLPHGEETQALKVSKEVLQAAQQKLTPAELDALWNSIVGIDSAAYQDSFTQGFRLGVQLTLEGLRPVYPD